MEYSPNKPKDIIIRFTDDDHVWINSRSFISLSRFQEAVNDAWQGGKNERISNVSPTVELKWIPCSERLPERNGRYLCTNDKLGGWITSINMWLGDRWLYPDKKPIAWMHLPDAWEGKEQTMSMISDLVDRLRVESKSMGEHRVDYMATLLMQASDTIIMLSEKARADRPQAKWIPCSERLPDADYGESDSVLCCTESGLMYILYWDGGNWCAPTGEPHQWADHKTGWHDKVIAWMPLPESYRGETGQ